MKKRYWSCFICICVMVTCYIIAASAGYESEDYGETEADYYLRNVSVSSEDDT